MAKTKKSTNKSNVLDWIVLGMQDKKAEDITILDVRHLKGPVVDYFVLCTANSDNQADAIYTSIEEKVFNECHEHPVRVDGLQTKEWIVLDYIDIMVHVMRRDKRAFYAIEELWGDATFLPVS
ncbi:MAG: ribosome silencing factor [Cytophagaceae bacterium]|nr:ribosome silencing factor [Cytophagaceae bacterium]